MEGKSVLEKLFRIQQELKAPKGQYNKFGNFHYRSCEDIQEAVKPILKELGAVLAVSDDIAVIGSRFYLKATAKIIDVESGESISNTAYAREQEKKPGMDEAQVTGSCSSYARKYALNGLFCIDDAKDPDYPQGQQAGESSGGREKPKSWKASKESLDRLRKEAARTGTDLSKVCKRYIVDRIEDLTEEQCEKAMRAFSRMESVPVQYGQVSMNFSENETPFR